MEYRENREENKGGKRCKKKKKWIRRNLMAREEVEGEISEEGKKKNKEGNKSKNRTNREQKEIRRNLIIKEGIQGTRK